MAIGRKYYDGPSAPPYVIVKFLSGLGFRLESRPQKARCYFFLSTTEEESGGNLRLFPLILPQPRPGQTAVAGGVIDQNVFVKGIESGLLPSLRECLDLWAKACAAGGVEATTFCVEPAQV